MELDGVEKELRNPFGAKLLILIKIKRCGVVTITQSVGGFFKV